jgi:lysozyme family protein
VRHNLQFLSDVGLVPSYADAIKDYLARTPDSSLPSYSSSSPSLMPAIHTDGDAIDTLLRFEGGYVDGRADRGGPMKFGIRLQELSRYRQRKATAEDLRELSIGEAREVYKKKYLSGPAGGIASVQVKAVYMNVTELLGRTAGLEILRSSLSALGEKDLSSSDQMTRLDVDRINAVDSDLLIGKMNCREVKVLEGRSYFKIVGMKWIRRIQALTTSRAQAACPELGEDPRKVIAEHGG